MSRALAVIIWLITLFAVVLFSGRYGWFPEGISEYAPAIDAQFMRTLVVVAIAFVSSQVLLGLYVWKYRDRQDGKAVYTHGNTKLEVLAMVVTASFLSSLRRWDRECGRNCICRSHPADAGSNGGHRPAIRVEYSISRARRSFGRTDPKLINDQENPVGLDPKDPASKDDIVSVNRMAIPVNRNIQVILRSKDVTHSFFVPALRFKQDTVPGLTHPDALQGLAKQVNMKLLVPSCVAWDITR